MTRISLRCAAWVAFALALRVAPARADTYVPLQPAHFGLWGTPALDGGGVNVLVQDNADGRTVFIDLRTPDGQWMFGQAAPAGAAVVAVLRLPQFRELDSGTLVLESVGCERLRLTVHSALLVGTLDLTPSARLPAGAGCYVCTGPDFSPPAPGC